MSNCEKRLSTAQLCQLAGDPQCVAKQNQFNTMNLITKMTAGTWTITSQVENRGAAKTNAIVTAHFYDSKGNNVGGLAIAKVTPVTLKTHQIGAFSIKVSASGMSGPASFVRLEYQ